MSSKQALDSLDMAELRYFLNELLELTGEGVKDAFLRDFPQKFNVDDVNFKISCEGVLAVVATVVGDSGCRR